MKKHIIILAFAAIVGVLSCNKQEEYISDQDNLVTFTAIQGDAPAVKTVLQSDGSIFWSPGNAINLFYGDSGSAKFISDCTEPAAQTNFTGSLDGFTPNGSDYFWAVYPYDSDNSFDGTAITLSLPAVQDGVAGSFADDLYYSIARTKDYTLHFYNVCGGIKFSVANEGIKYVTFRGNADEVLAGQVNVAFNGEGRPEVVDDIDGKKVVRLDAPDGGTFEVGKWYYIVTLPATLNSGYTMSFYSDQLLAERSSDKKVTIKRSVWGKLTDADDVEMPITPNKYLTFTSEGTTTISLVNEGGNAPVLYYSTDTANWTRWDYSGLKVTKEAPLYLCGENPGGINVNSTEYSKFVFFGDPLSIDGDIMSLINCDEDVTVIPNEKCFMLLFRGCSGLKKGPSLPATELTESCYNSMYSGCSGLTVAPELPAMVLKEWCYAGMFEDCTSLLTPPELPARSLAKFCYDQMFFGCSNMAKAPTLPATSMAQSCYAAMFAKCSSLETAPALPALTLAYACYESMFIDCVSLTDAPELPATSLTTSCYQNMFLGCESLSIAPVLPATSLAELCYYQMFEGCINLSEAPDLPAAELSKACYSNMFFDCSNLKYVKCLATDISASGCLQYWLSGTNNTGTFVKAPEMNDWPTGSSGIPEGWTVVDDEDVSFSANNYLTFTSEGITCIALANYSGNAPVLYYSLDKKAWTQWDYSELTITNESPIYICGDNPDGLNAYKHYSYFTSQGDPFSVSGSIMSLLNYQEDITVIPCDDCFYKLFQDCTNLVSAPDLPATTLTEYCYSQLFIACSGLVSAPALPAKDLETSCYEKMFYKCSSLTEAPSLPATTLVKNCYKDLFRSCSNLRYVKCLATDISASGCLSSWVSNVPSEGTFVKASGMNDWPTGSSGIPEGWKVLDDENGGVLSVSKYLTITSEGETRVGLHCFGGNAPILYYSTDKVVWTLWQYSVLEYSMLSVTRDKPVYICGYNPTGFNHSLGAYSNFFSYGSPFCIKGDIMSLLDYQGRVSDVPCDYCFNNLFASCNNLVIGPDLPSKTLKEACYYGLFNGCERLSSSPALPSQSLEISCYERMFAGCISLETAPLLPATSLARSCYASMFYGCENLEKTPELPALFLADSCYYQMFRACSRMTSAPELPARILYNHCYESMFQDCAALVLAPELPAPKLTEDCYKNMFSSCSKLFYIKCLATDISTQNGLTNWVGNVADDGYFIKSADTSWSSGGNGIPSGWTIIEDNVSLIDPSSYLSFKTDGLSTVALVNYGDNAPILFFSVDGNVWKRWEYQKLPLVADLPLYICGDNPLGLSKSGSKYSSFSTTGDSLRISGDIMSLINSHDSLLEIPCDYCFYRLFFACGNLLSAPDLPATTLADSCYSNMFSCTSLSVAPELPATVLSDNCYSSMFYGCTSLTTAPSILPAVQLTENCYASMFYNCTSLSKAPELPATVLSSNCYSSMFYGCTSLTTAPSTLPATKLAKDCYASMFYNCTSLSKVPELPATTLASGCYASMFYNCTSLSEAPELPATILASECYSKMFYGCNSLATAPQLPATVISDSCYRNMFEKCTSLTTAPRVLPAVKLAENCYESMFSGCISLQVAPVLPSPGLRYRCYDSMFSGCSSLSYVKCLAKVESDNPADISEYSLSDFCRNWLSKVASSGSFVKAADANGWPSGVSGIPEGWTVLDAE